MGNAQNKKAITALKSLKDELFAESSTKKTIHTDNWRTRAVSLIDTYFGKDSVEFARITAFKFFDPLSITHPRFTEEDANKQIAANMVEIADFLDDCIVTIKQKGIKNTSSNRNNLKFFSKTFFAWIVAVFVIGYVLGAYNNPKSVFMYMVRDICHLPQPQDTRPAK